MKRALFAFAFVLAVLSAAPVTAQTSLGLFGTGSKHNGSTEWTAGGGVAIRSRFLVFLGTEFSAGYRYDNYTANGAKVLKVEQVPFLFSLLVYLPLGPVRPYALGGGGYYYTRSEGQGAASGEFRENKWAAHAGAGLELQLGPKFFLHADGRYVFMHISTVNDFNAIFGGTQKPEFVSASLGLNFQF